jgi:hypothetical protein
LAIVIVDVEMVVTMVVVLVVIEAFVEKNGRAALLFECWQRQWQPGRVINGDRGTAYQLRFHWLRRVMEYCRRWASSGSLRSG